MKYTTVFFDLDETLWHYYDNAQETLSDLFEEYGLANHIEESVFKTTFFEINRSLWSQFDKGLIDKYEIRETRFRKTLGKLNIQQNGLAVQLQTGFMERCPRKSGTFPGALEIVQALRKHYDLHIITNGFEDIQHIKMQSAGLLPYFQHIVTSEAAGAQKPEPEIFRHALELSGSEAASSLMIGDNLIADVQGAINAGMDAFHFNPFAREDQPRSSNEIRHLGELRDLLL